MFVDTHCHIQSAGLTVGERSTRELWAKNEGRSIDDIVSDAQAAGVSQMLCVGCDVPDSALAVQCVQDRDGLFASIGIHPHEAQIYENDAAGLAEFAGLATRPKVVAVGECGLDYYYAHSPREAQIPVLEYQLDLAQKHKLPVIFHVREAFDDFWPIFDNFPGLTGVLHSFTDSATNLQKALDKGLFIGVNGIATFVKGEEQQAVYKAVPLERLLLETDAPFLTPVPLRGKICEPKYVRHTAEFLSTLRGESLEKLSKETTKNARSLFNLA